MKFVSPGSGTVRYDSLRGYLPLCKIRLVGLWICEIRFVGPWLSEIRLAGLLLCEICLAGLLALLNPFYQALAL